MRKVGSVSITNIGIQSISGRAGTPLQPQHKEPANENERDETTTAPEAEAAAEAIAEPEAEKQAPPPPGLGKLVDLTV